MRMYLNHIIRHVKFYFLSVSYCLACCGPVSVYAQSRIEIPADAKWSRTLINELEVISDEERKWSAESLFATSKELFEPNSVAAKPKLHNYWARFELANNNDSEQWVSFESYYWDYVRLYFRDSTGNITEIPFGILSNPYDNKFLVRPNAHYDVLANFSSNGQFRREDNINLVLKSTLPALESKAFTNYMDGITFGIMFGLALYNLCLFISLRDRTYFWYTLYILSFALSFATLFATTPPKWTQFFTSDYPFFAFYIKKIADPIIWISYVNFVRNFLATKDRHPVWDIVLKICIALILLQFLINFIGIHHFSGISRSMTWNAPVVICFVLAIISYFKGYTRARFFVVGQIFLLAGILITGAHYSGLDAIAFLPETEFYNYFRNPSSIFVCGAAESIVFSFALADKYNMLQKDIARVKIEKEKEKQDMLASQNVLLEQQVNEQTKELRQSLEDLRATQDQLVQAEKMASLGALTAGIAHEIQNPLNFINNFSEINIEIVEDLAAENMQVDTNGKEESAFKLLKNLKKNSEKINLHGRRLDAIVKSMLQHSRSGATHIEPVDINAMCDECLRLAYHGFRATEIGFNAKYETEFDPNLPKTSAIQQDLSRSILNIINNALYAVNMKRKELIGEEGEVSYCPLVKVKTAMSLQDISITIADNGSGIHDDVLDKIFQPFFTTKPSGKGTGLGLSLTYDIIVKGHGGELKVRSKKGFGTEFEILLPVKKLT